MSAAPTDPSTPDAGGRYDLPELASRAVGERSLVSGHAVREQIADAATLGGRQFWRSLDELAGTEAFDELVRREYPEQAGLLAGLPGNPEGGRREFLKLMAASLAIGGVAGCTRQPEEKIVPYASSPEQRVPGRPQYFATAMPLGGSGCGVLVESHEGRPTKIEGNPDHPSSLGASNAIQQGSVLGLYDPDRSQVVKKSGRISTWERLFEAQRGRVEQARGAQGRGLWILSPTISSPTLARQREALLAALPEARWTQYEPVNRDRERAAALLALGLDVVPRYRFDNATRIVALDADFLSRGSGHLRYAKDFAKLRRARGSSGPGTEGAGQMSRLYAIESVPTNTGATADERLVLAPREIEVFAEALAKRVGVPGLDAASPPAGSAPWIEAVGSDLIANRGRSIVVAGPECEPRLQALAHAINFALMAHGRTVDYSDPVEPAPSDQLSDLEQLVAAMRAGEVESLLCLGGNPVYDAPADLEFAAALDGVEWRMHASLYEDETSELCHWHAAASHYLESWSDVRGHEGTATIVQPLISPLYGTRTEIELAAELLVQAGVEDVERSGYDAVRSTWRAQLGEQGFEERWERALHDGLIAGSRFEPRMDMVPLLLPPRGAEPRAESRAEPRVGSQTEDFDLVLSVAPDASSWDGRFANNGWLQELPRPLSMLTWDNAALVAPALAAERGLANGDLCRLTLGQRSLEAAVWIQPGQAERVVHLHLGYGRQRAGRLGSGTGFDVNRLLSAQHPWGAAGLRLEPLGASYPFATTQHHHSMEGRDIVRVETFDRFRAGHVGAPHAAAHGDHAAAEHAPAEHAETGDVQAEPALAHEENGYHDSSLYKPYPYDGNAWGMVIDLGACTGCRACVISCQAENNVPIVGKTEVARGREMHWLRVDRYYASPAVEAAHEHALDGAHDEQAGYGELAAAAAREPEIHHQPVPCMHCENAPCEVVCPVGATVHGDEGLNEMVYNRCVGTRYCSNNCPYKVRRFNFFKYADHETEVLKLGRNPDVTVRSRGVMEKCTYCVQRINKARQAAKRDGRPIADGEIRTACQSVCPTDAIAFGNLNDAQSQVAAERAEPHEYGLLAELNTKPRTTYLAKIKNPNPALHG